MDDFKGKYCDDGEYPLLKTVVKTITNGKTCDSTTSVAATTTKAKVPVTSAPTTTASKITSAETEKPAITDKKPETGDETGRLNDFILSALVNNLL